MILLVLLGLTFFIQLLVSPWFVMVETSSGGRKALKYRLLCMGIFIADTLLCGAIANAHTHPYFILIGVGMLVSFIAGVLASALKEKGEQAYFALQSVVNLLYTSAFVFQLHNLRSSLIIGPKELASTVIPLAISFLLIPLMCRKNKKIQPLSVFSVISATLMCAKAIHLGIFCQQTTLPIMQAVSCSVIMGALALSLSILLATRQRISPPPQGKPQLPKYCMYFFGQMLIACSILICGGLK